MEFVIITGLSGAGKTIALHALEDIDFYCVDNLPVELIPVFYDLCIRSGDERMKKLAVVVDIRGGEIFDSLFSTMHGLKKEDKKYKLLFLDARDDVLATRYKETRRKHPLSGSFFGSLEDAVKTERQLLEKIKESADYLIDSTLLSPAQLKERITSLFLGNSFLGLSVTCMSFGFKYGFPSEADLVFDVRCLPNPYYIDELKKKTGLDKEVSDYVLNSDKTKGLIDRIFSLIDYTLPLYVEEGKSQLVVAIGCTGGKHRSVTIAQELYSHLNDMGKRVNIQHRDISKN